MKDKDLVKLHNNDNHARLGTDREDTMKLGLFLSEFKGLSNDLIDVRVPTRYRVPLDTYVQYLQSDFLSDMYLSTNYVFKEYTNNIIFDISLKLLLDCPSLSTTRYMGRAEILK